MKNEDKAKLFDVSKISEMLGDNFDDKALVNFFEEGKIKGQKIEGKWYASKDEFDDLEEVLWNELINFVDLHALDISNVELKGRILDIGGGGEGIIGQLKGERVVAIDRRESELIEAAPGDYLKIVMDAKELKFLDESFETATAFFTFMYAPLLDHEKIFQEIYRVLKDGGEFAMWDLTIPKRDIRSKNYYGVNLEVTIGDKNISTGYAVSWKKEQNLKYYSNLGKTIGFKILEQDVINETFYIRFQKNK